MTIDRELPPPPPPRPPTSVFPAGSELLPAPLAADSADGADGGQRPDRRPMWIIGAAVVVVVAFVVSLVRFDLFSDSEYPSAWDSRLGDLPVQVAKLRGLQFEHPVRVRFLNEADFKKEVGVDPKPSKRRREKMDRFTESLRALGLLTGEVDLLQSIDDEQQSGVLAFYSPGDEEIVVRGTGAPDAARRVTLAHELTHVLQDQHFDLDRVEERVAKEPEGSVDALRAVIEGDAVRIEDRYVEQLSRADQKAYDTGREREQRRAESGTEDVPAIVDLQFSAPYRYGPPVLAVLAAEGGNANVNRAFQHGVFTQKLFIEPSASLADAKPLRVAAPKVGPGEKRIEKPDTFGAFDLYLVLASRLPAGDALVAATKWAGGRMITYRADGRTCVRAAVRARTAAGRRALDANLRVWAAALPSGQATIGSRGPAVTLDACDPGTDASVDSPDPALTKAGNLLDIHGELEAGIAKDAHDAGAPPSTARCFALEIARSAEIAVLLEQDEADVTPKMARRAVNRAGERAAEKCLKIPN